MPRVTQSKGSGSNWGQDAWGGAHIVLHSSVIFSILLFFLLATFLNQLEQSGAEVCAKLTVAEPTLQI